MMIVIMRTTLLPVPKIRCEKHMGLNRCAWNISCLVKESRLSIETNPFSAKNQTL